MLTSNRAFLIELYGEYLEEASFLYEQRLSLFKNPEIGWTKIGDCEDRFEAHIDGLVVGEELAIDVCKARILDGDFGEMHAAIRVFCRKNRRDLVMASLGGIDFEDQSKVKAVMDALRYELPVSWYAEIAAIAKMDPALAAELMTVFGYLRAAMARDVSNNLRSCSTKSVPQLLWAAGRIGDSHTCAELCGFLEDSDVHVRSVAAVALLRLRDAGVVRQILYQPISETWQLIPAGLAGVRSTARSLLEFAKSYQVNNDCLIALGILGDIAAIPTLLTFIADPKTAAVAASSLQLMTGGSCFEHIFVSDEIAEDELFEDEIQRFRQGEVPLRGDGKPFGRTVVRLSQKCDDWSEWWTNNSPAFDSQLRYRNGQPYSPKCLLECLESPETPHTLRQLAYEELVIRYGLDVCFEADMFVVHQKNALSQVRDWVQLNGHRFRDGVWYLYASPVY